MKTGYAFPGLELFGRNVYGEMKLYPANEAAEGFAELLRVKTFSKAQLELIQKLGHPLRFVADPKLNVAVQARRMPAEDSL